jgi:diguanylate cyclase (GGDEF)-like protein
MVKPQNPENELKRLEILKSLNILDTLPENSFDRVTRIAKSIFGVSISLVSLIDKDRQWFKSSQGISIKETSRDTSFCGHAILGDDIFNIPDASKDERFSDNPFVIGNPNIRFYAGYPIKSSKGFNIGTLCIIDTKPKILTYNEKIILEDLASIINQELKLIELSSFDDLTNLYNRRTFISLGDKALYDASTKKESVSVLYFDINKFKNINDSFGHEQGDFALINFSNIMRESFRDSDILCRIGGDEFVVLLKRIDNIQTKDLLKRFEWNINIFNKNKKYDIEYSVGFINLKPKSEDKLDNLLKISDIKMYENKSLYKNKLKS